MTRQQTGKATSANLEAAISAHKAGQHAQAEALYRESLKSAPNDAQAHYLLGALYYDLKQFEQTLESLDRAIGLRPQHWPSHALLGAVSMALQRFGDAVRHFKTVALATPTSLEAQINLGSALNAARQFGEAESVYRRALGLHQPSAKVLHGLAVAQLGAGHQDAGLATLRQCVAQFPEFAPGFISLGQNLAALGNYDEAAATFENGLNHHPGHTELLLLLANLRYRQRRPEEAEGVFRRLLDLDPQHASAHNQLGAVLADLGRWDESERAIRRALALSPHDAEAETNLGRVLQARGDTPSAIQHHQRAIDINPSNAEAWNNLGISLQYDGAFERALVCFDKAVELKPGFLGALSNKSFALLILGRLREGWAVYRHRFDKKIDAAKKRVWPFPEWSGESLKGKSILLWADQGLGDEVLYSSMIGDMTSRGARCIFECTARMAPLFQRSFPDVLVVPRRTPAVPDIEQARPDFHLALADLGAVVRADLASFPRHGGYLKANITRRDQLRARYEAKANGQRIVGIAWKSTNPQAGVFKSLALSSWAKVLKTQNVFFVSLQYGDQDRDLAEAVQQTGVSIYRDTEVDAIADPDDFAAQVAAMDRVISTSNTTVHFAGAMNVPVWTLVPNGQGALWYWFLERADSPWYPSMTLFRQQAGGNWNSTMDQVAARLDQWART